MEMVNYLKEEFGDVPDLLDQYSDAMSRMDELIKKHADISDDSVEADSPLNAANSGAANRKT